MSSLRCLTLLDLAQWAAGPRWSAHNRNGRRCQVRAPAARLAGVFRATSLVACGAVVGMGRRSQRGLDLCWCSLRRFRSDGRLASCSNREPLRRRSSAAAARLEWISDIGRADRFSSLVGGRAVCPGSAIPETQFIEICRNPQRTRIVCRVFSSCCSGLASCQRFNRWWSIACAWPLCSTTPLPRSSRSTRLLSKSRDHVAHPSPPSS